MSVAHMDARCACGCTMAVPGKPQEDADGRIIGYRFICAECGATMWTTWTEEYESEMAAEAFREQKGEKARAVRRKESEDRRAWIREMREWEQSNPAVRTFLQRMACCYGQMDSWTLAWDHQVTWTVHEACKAIMEASA